MSIQIDPLRPGCWPPWQPLLVPSALTLWTPSRRTEGFLTTVSLCGVVHSFQGPPPSSAGKSNQPLGLEADRPFAKIPPPPSPGRMRYLLPWAPTAPFLKRQVDLLTPKHSILMLVSSLQIEHVNEWSENTSRPHNSRPVFCA